MMASPTASEERVRGRVICASHHKQIYAVVDEPHLTIVVNKLKGPSSPYRPCEAECATATNAAVFKFLNGAGVRTSFVSSLDSTSFLARRCTMIPFKWVVRRIANGSFLKRHPEVQEGYRFSPLRIETFYKVPYSGRRATCLFFESSESAPPAPPSQYEVSSADNAYSDPEWNSAQVLSFPLEALRGRPVSKREYHLMEDTTAVVFEVLERIWATLGCTLVDMKVEYGIDQETGELLLSDVIDNECWCLWANKHSMTVDKQVDRTDFGEEKLQKGKLDYDWVRSQLDVFTTGPSKMVVILVGSSSEGLIGNEIKKHCENLKLPGLEVVSRVLPEHQVTADTLRIVAHYNSLPTPVVFVAVAGLSNGLGPVLAGSTTLPVINCPPWSSEEASHVVWSTPGVPSDLSCCAMRYPETAALYAASIFAITDHRTWARLRCLKLEMRTTLEAADHVLQTKDGAEMKERIQNHS